MSNEGTITMPQPVEPRNLWMYNPLNNHLKKMGVYGKLECNVLKYVKVSSQGFGVVLIILISSSLD